MVATVLAPDVTDAVDAAEAVLPHPANMSTERFVPLHAVAAKLGRGAPGSMLVVRRGASCTTAQLGSTP